jgi:predicted esterase YcpF (UPF0227 family)
MKIMYVHGIGSGKNDNTVTWIKETFKNHKIYTFDIPFDPDEAIEFINKKCSEYDINMIIGTSLGGFYAMTVSGVQKILINPAIKAYETAETIGYGVHEYFCERDDGIQTYEINADFVNKLRKIYDAHIKNIDCEMICETYAIFGNEDDVCDFKTDFEKTYRKSQMITADFGHRMTKEIFNIAFMTIFKKAENDFNTRVW